jgi:hypothetical protein
MSGEKAEGWLVLDDFLLTQKASTASVAPSPKKPSKIATRTDGAALATGSEGQQTDPARIKR